MKATCWVRRDVMTLALAAATDEQRSRLAVLGSLNGNDPRYLGYTLTGGGALSHEMAAAVGDILRRSVGELFDVDARQAQAASKLPDAKRGPTVPFVPQGHVGPRLRREPGGRR